MSVLPKDLRQASPHRLSRSGDSLRRRRFLGGLGLAQSSPTPHSELLFSSQLDRPSNNGPLRHTVRRRLLQLLDLAVLRGRHRGFQGVSGSYPRFFRPDDVHVGHCGMPDRAHRESILQFRIVLYHIA
jgi:hypothetical protein